MPENKNIQKCVCGEIAERSCSQCGRGVCTECINNPFSFEGENIDIPEKLENLELCWECTEQLLNFVVKNWLKQRS